MHAYLLLKQYQDYKFYFWSATNAFCSVDYCYKPEVLISELTKQEFEYHIKWKWKYSFIFFPHFTRNYCVSNYISVIENYDINHGYIVNIKCYFINKVVMNNFNKK